jgi:hypothetical protein
MDFETSVLDSYHCPIKDYAVQYILAEICTSFIRPVCNRVIRLNCYEGNSFTEVNNPTKCINVYGICAIEDLPNSRRMLPHQIQIHTHTHNDSLLCRLLHTKRRGSIERNIVYFVILNGVITCMKSEILLILKTIDNVVRGQL